MLLMEASRAINDNYNSIELKLGIINKMFKHYSVSAVAWATS